MPCRFHLIIMFEYCREENGLFYDMQECFAYFTAQNICYSLSQKHWQGHWHGTQNASYRDTLATIPLISRYIGHDTTRITKHGTRYNSYRDGTQWRSYHYTWDTIQLIA